MSFTKYPKIYEALDMLSTLKLFFFVILYSRENTCNQHIRLNNNKYCYIFKNLFAHITCYTSDLSAI